MCLTIASVAFIISMTPIKLAFLVTTVSVRARTAIYLRTGARFPRAALVISFSSGMIILFCYCATLSNHERKRRIRIVKVIVLTLIPVLIVIEEQATRASFNLESLSFRQLFFLTVAITTVIIAIVCINKRMFHPKKSLIRSY